jgi:hypothetical protein
MRFFIGMEAPIPQRSCIQCFRCDVRFRPVVLKRSVSVEDRSADSRRQSDVIEFLPGKLPKSRVLSSFQQRKSWMPKANGWVHGLTPSTGFGGCQTVRH